MSLPLSHLAPAAVYRESAQAAIAGQINGSGGCAGKRTGAVAAAFRTTRENRATSALNPADPWPFTKIAPQSDADWRLTAPEAEF